MLLDRLLAHFDAYTSLHVDVNDVRDQMIEMGIQDEIRFHFVDMDKDKVRGLLHRYIRRDRPYAEPKFCSDIIIANDMGDEGEAWQRVVAVKELLHITDCLELSAQSAEAVDNLFEKFSIPPELRHKMPYDPGGRSFLNDEVRIYAALAVLVPSGCRESLRGPYSSGRLSDREIAQLAKIPLRYIPVVMGESFEPLIARIIAWESVEERAPRSPEAANDPEMSVNPSKVVEADRPAE